MTDSHVPPRELRVSSGHALSRQRVASVGRSWAPCVRCCRSRSSSSLAAHGEERTAAVGDVLFQVGDRRYPFIAILEGEAAILDAAGNEIDPPRRLGLPRRDEPAVRADRLPDRGRHPAACATSPSTATRCARCSSTTGRSATSCCRRSSPGARRCSRCEGVGLEVDRPALVRADTRDRRLRAAQPAAVHLARPRARRSDADAGARRRARRRRAAARAAAGRPGAARPVDRARSRARSGSASSSPRARRSTSSSSAAGRPVSAPPSTARPRGSTRSSSRARALGGQAGTSRRIENYLGFPAGITGSELTSRAVTQARKFDARTATPYRAVVARARRRTATSSASRRTTRSSPAPSCSRRAPSTAACRSTGSPTTRASASSTPPGRPRRSAAARTRVGVVGGGNSAGQAAVWLARGGALVTLLHRRADLRETMSDYLVHELERYGVAVRDRSEIAELHGADGELEAVTLDDGERLPFSFLFLFLGAAPCTDWLGDARRARRERLRPHRRRRRRRRPARDERARGSSPPATSARARPSAARPPSARARWSCASCTTA